MLKFNTICGLLSAATRFKEEISEAGDSFERIRKIESDRATDPSPTNLLNIRELLG